MPGPTHQHPHDLLFMENSAAADEYDTEEDDDDETMTQQQQQRQRSRSAPRPGEYFNTRSNANGVGGNNNKSDSLSNIRRSALNMRGRLTRRSSISRGGGGGGGGRSRSSGERSVSRGGGRRRRSHSPGGGRGGGEGGRPSPRDARKMKLFLNYDKFNSRSKSLSRGLGRSSRGGGSPSPDDDDARGGRGRGSSSFRKPQQRRRSLLARRRGGNNNNNGWGGDEETGDRHHRGGGGGRDDDDDEKNRRDHRSHHPHQHHHHHPWILPHHLRLAPRIDVWFAFAVSSCAAVSSIGQIHASSRSEGLLFSSADNFALSACIISFIVSLGVAVGMRYAPSRNAMTRPVLGSSMMTPELLLLSVLLVFWIAAVPIVVDGDAYYGSDYGVPLAMAGSSIWNANLFYSSWASFLICGYLWIEVFTLADRDGTLHDGEASSNNRQGPPSSGIGAPDTNAFTKRWALLSSNALIIMSAAISTYQGPACVGTVLRQTGYCTLALTGIVVGGVLQLLVGLAVAALYRLSGLSPGVLNSQLRRSRGGPGAAAGGVLSARRRDAAAGASAVASLVLQAVNAGLLTTPSGGGPGNVSGTLYFGSWLGVVLAFETCLRYLELYSTATTGSGGGGGAAVKRSQIDKRSQMINLVETATIHTEEDDDEDEEEEESLLKLRNGNGSEDERSGRSRALLRNSPANHMVEDASVDQYGDDYTEQQSYVFSRQPSPSPVQNPHARDPESVVEPLHGEGGADPEERSSSAARSVSRSSRGSKGSRRSKGSKGSRRSKGSKGSRRSKSSGGSDQSMRGMSDPGSIDVRSAPADEETGPLPGGRVFGGGNDPDGTSSFQKSKHFDEYTLEDYEQELRDEQDLRNSDLFRKDGGGEDDVIHRGPSAFSSGFPSFHMNQAEVLDDVPAQEPSLGGSGQNHAAAAAVRQSSNVTNLSPLEEGSGEEVSPNAGDESAGLPDVGGAAVPSRRMPGDNLKAVQSMMYASSAVHKVRTKGANNPNSAASSSRKSSASLSTRSASRERGGLSSRGGGGGGGGQASKHSSRQSKQGSAKTRGSNRSRGQGAETDHSDQQKARGLRKSSGSRKSNAPSVSTMSSRGGGDQSALITEHEDDMSGSDPPPTVSDAGTSVKNSLAEFSGLTNSNSTSGNRNNANSAAAAMAAAAIGAARSGGARVPPPPPPFPRGGPAGMTQQQQQHGGDNFDVASQYTSSAPMQSIHTRSRGSNDTDTIVSDPTLDPGLRADSVDMLSPMERHKTDKTKLPMRKSSSSTGSYEKKMSDETEMIRQTSSSDEPPSSQEGGGETKAVDNIVMAALAYAEKTHGDGDSHGLGGAAPSQRGGLGRPPIPQRGKSTKGSMHLPSPNDRSSSIHSFFTESEGSIEGDRAGDGVGGGMLRESRSGEKVPVDDLVARALSHAHGQLEGAPQRQQQKQKSMMTSEYTAGYWSSENKSVGSMYSETTEEFSQQQSEMDFDC